MHLLPVVGLVQLGWNNDFELKIPLRNLNVALHAAEQAQSTLGANITRVTSITLLPMSPADRPVLVAIREATLEDNLALLTARQPGYWRFEDPSTGECQELIELNNALVARFCGDQGPENVYTPGVAFSVSDDVIVGDTLQAGVQHGCVSTGQYDRHACMWGSNVAVLDEYNQLLYLSHSSYERRKEYLKHRFRGHKRAKDGGALVFRIARYHTFRRATEWRREGRRLERWDRSDECLVLERLDDGSAAERWGFCGKITDIPAAQESRRW